MLADAVERVPARETEHQGCAPYPRSCKLLAAAQYAARTVPRRLIDEWKAIDGNDTALVNATLCSMFPSDYCPDGERQGLLRCCRGMHTEVQGGRTPRPSQRLQADMPPPCGLPSAAKHQPCLTAPPTCSSCLPLCLAPTPAVDARSKYGVTAEAQGACQLGRWLVPDACLLPVPFPVAVQLSEWERVSHNLTASADARQAFQGGRAAWG